MLGAINGHSLLMSCCFREKKDAVYQLVQDAIDFVIPTSSVGWINADEGLVGIAG